MIIEQLYFNKQLLDLEPNSITRNIQIGDIGDISVKKSSFSYSIKIPKTDRNIIIFGMLGISGNTSRKPYENVVCDYIVDSIPLINNGYIVVSGSNDKYYNIVVYNGVIDLGEKLKNYKLTDLPLADLNHTLTTQTYTDSFGNSEGYIYALANFGLGLNSGTTVKVENQAPSIYVHTLFRRILETSGLNLVGDFFSTNTDYLTEVLTPSKGITITDQTYTSNDFGDFKSNTLSDFQQSANYITFEKKFDLNNISLSGGLSISDNKLIVGTTGVYEINLDVTVNNSFQTHLQLKTRVNDNTKSVVNLPNSGAKTVSLTINLTSGDEVEFYISGSSFYPYELPDYGAGDGFYISYNIDFESSVNEIEGGQYIDVIDYLDDTDQLTFIKDVINRYGLVLHPINGTNDYRFKQLDEILKDRVNYEDWTDKFSRLDGEDYIPNYAKQNYFKYKYPEEITVPNNDGYFELENENIEADKTIYTSPFEIPTNQKALLDGNTIYNIPIWELEDSEIKNAETPAKLMRINRVNTSITAKLFDEVTGILVSENVPFLSLVNMSMQYFLGNYYPSFTSLLNSFKEVGMICNLNVIDIHNLDFFKLKYFRQTGRFYYLDSVRYKAGDKASKLKLIEILNFVQNLPPSNVGDYTFNLGHGSTKSITLSNLIDSGYFDPEFDTAYKIKIISGFNSNVELYQNGVLITSETEILTSELSLEAVETVDGISGYSESWTYTIMDSGSMTYSSDTGTIQANIIELENVAPIANAGADQITTLPPPEITYDIHRSLNGSGSTDDTGEIIYYSWSITSSPAGTTAYIQPQDTSTPIATLVLPNHADTDGVYTLTLTVKDEYGLSDTDTMTVTVNPYT